MKLLNAQVLHFSAQIIYFMEMNHQASTSDLRDFVYKDIRAQNFGVRDVRDKYYKILTPQKNYCKKEALASTIYLLLKFNSSNPGMIFEYSWKKPWKWYVYLT